MPIAVTRGTERAWEHKLRWIKTIAMFSCFMQIGLSMGIVGPTLIDLRYQTDAELTKTALVLPFRAAGYAIGAFVTGIIYDYVNMQVLTFVTMFVSGAMTLSVPFLQDIWIVLALFLTLGLSLGLFEAGSDMFIMHIWGEKNPPYMQALHLFFGLGAFIAPTVAQPFLVSSGESAESVEECFDQLSPGDLGISTTASSILNSSSITVEKTRLIYPYGIVSLYSFLNGSIFLLIWWFWPQTPAYPSESEEPFDLSATSPRTASMSLTPSVRRRHDSYVSNKSENRTLARQLSQLSGASVRGGHGPDLLHAATRNAAAASVPSALPASPRPARRGDKEERQEVKEQARAGHCPYENGWILVVVIVTAMFMHIYYGLEITFGSFLTTYTAKSHLNLDTKVGASLTSVFWGTFTFWRLITIFYMAYVGITWTIVINLVIMIVGNVFLVPFGDKYQWSLWVGTATIGAGISPIWACMFGFLAQYMSVTSRIAAVMITSAIIGEFIFPVIIAKYIACQPMVFSWVTLACSVSISLLFLLIVTICKIKLQPAKKQLSH